MYHHYYNLYFTTATIVEWSLHTRVMIEDIGIL